MNKTLYRVTGSFLIFAALLGWIASLGGLVFVWKAKPVIETSALNTIDMADRTLAVSEDLLSAAQDTLVQAEQSADSLSVTVSEVGATLQTTSEMAASISNLLGGSMSKMVEQSQKALSAMQTSARIIDNTLDLISAIPFMRIKQDDSAPLAESVSELSTSLDPLPNSLASMQKDMGTTSENLSSMQASITSLEAMMTSIQQNLTQARTAVEAYQETAAQTRQSLADARVKLPTWLSLGAWALTVILVWLMIAQFGLLAQGWEMMFGRPVFPESKPKTEEIPPEIISASETEESSSEGEPGKS